VNSPALQWSLRYWWGIYLFVVGFTYQLALPGRKLTFPAAHYSHPTSKPNVVLHGFICKQRAVKSMAIKLLFFVSACATGRRKQKSRRCFTELYMAHFALSDIAAKEVHVPRTNQSRLQ